jgi:hypothetical protein
MTVSTADNLLRLAAMIADTDDEELCAALCAEIDDLSEVDLRLLLLATKFVQRKPYRLVSKDPHTVRRSLEFAQHIGALINLSESDGFTEIDFRPPQLQ